MIIKSIVYNEKAKNRLQQYQKWSDFIDQTWSILTSQPGDPNIYQPSDEVMRAKEKQIMGVRAGRFTPS